MTHRLSKISHQNHFLSQLPTFAVFFIIYRLRMQQSTYDTYCTHQDCISKGNVFFNFSPNNPHVVDHADYIFAIHPMMIQTLLNNSNSQEFTVMLREKYQEKVKSSISVLKDHIFGFLYQKFLEYFGQKLEKKLESVQKFEAQYLMQHLSSGDVDLVKNIVRFKGQKTALSFPNFMKLQDEQDMGLKIHESVSSFNEKILKMFQNLFTNFDEQMNFSQDQMFGENTPQFSKRRSVVPTRYEEYHEISCEEDDNCKSDCSQYQIVDKRNKPINKIIKKQTPRHRSKHKKIKKIAMISNCGSFQKQVNPQNEVKLLNCNELIVHTCTNPLKTYTYILRQFKQIHVIHIFSPKFACRQNMKKILKDFIHLHTLTLNCDHQFYVNDLYRVPEDKLQHIKRFDMKWNIGQFFKEYHLWNSFPIKPWNDRQRMKTFKIPKNIWNIMKENDTIWIDSDEHVSELLQSNEDLSRIRVLHFAPKNKKLGHIKCLSELSTLRNLVVMYLRNVTFGQSKNYFNAVINRNPALTTILIAYCDFQEIPASEYLMCLKNLPHLTNFSLQSCKSTDPTIIDPAFITSLHNIENLFLSQINFANNDDYFNSSCLKDFANLKKLKRLELYACNPIFTDFFNFLSEEVLQNLELLNIGMTQVNINFLNHLARMPNLIALNIDCIRFPGGNFLNLCEQYQARNGKKWPLKYLSIEESQQKLDAHRFSVRNLRQVGRLLPQLQYIYIVGCSHLKGYAFEEFHNLHTICLDKMLSQFLPSKNKANRYVL